MISWAAPGGGLLAQGTATTGSVGAISFSAAAQSDTIVSLPLHRAHSFRGAVASASGAQLTLEQASFAEDAFNHRFYLLVESGAGEGRWFPIADTSGATLTLDLDGDASPTFFNPGTAVRIIPFWTLDTVFPDGRGVNASGSLLPASRILLPDTSRAGVRLGTDYPAPVVEFKASRDRALETFRQLRGDAANPAVERPRKSSTSPMRLRKA